MIKNSPKVVVDFDDLADLCDSNFLVVMRHVNAHEDKIKEIATALDKLTKKTKHKAGKGLVFFAIAAGIGYIIKNERDKQRMTMDILNLGKQKYGLSSEDEGDAIEPLGI